MRTWRDDDVDGMVDVIELQTWDEAGQLVARSESFPSCAQEGADADAPADLSDDFAVDYDRDENGIPQRWVEVMKESIVSALPQFSTQRMLVDYTEEAYLPLGRRQ